MTKNETNKAPLFEIKAQSNAWGLNLKEVWNYKDLLLLFVRRDFVSVYKQTILGPLWFFIQPLLTTITFTLIFGKVAKIGTDGAPDILFYLAGVTAWNYFAECLKKNSDTFRTNQNLFSKVYFPRLIIPASIVISSLFQFAIQFLLFLSIYLYYLLSGANVEPNITVLLLPAYIMIMAGLGLGLGLIVSSMVTKYRDLSFLVNFIVQLWMYATPVVYPLSKIPDNYKLLVRLNPMTNVIENFKYSFFGTGQFNALWLIYSAGFMIIAVIIGGSIFKRVEKSFLDTV